MATSSDIDVTVAAPTDLPDLVRFLRALSAMEEPDDPAAPDRAEADLRRSLACFDFLRSDACWLFLARVDGEPAGYSFVVRVPKTDRRTGFLFVDEVAVLPAYRRQGVARALLAAVKEQAGQLGLAGVRLLVRPENGPARALYRHCGFDESETMFCQWQGGNP